MAAATRSSPFPTLRSQHRSSFRNDTQAGGRGLLWAARIRAGRADLFARRRGATTRAAATRSSATSQMPVRQSSARRAGLLPECDSGAVGMRVTLASKLPGGRRRTEISPSSRYRPPLRSAPPSPAPLRLAPVPLRPTREAIRRRADVSAGPRPQSPPPRPSPR